jgi:UDP-2,3-diacylglucosamine hydrolase
MGVWFSRLGPMHSVEDVPFLGPVIEWLVQYALERLKHEPIDYFIFGHRHLALEYPLPNNSLYVNLGDWIHYNSYGVFDGNDLKLEYYKGK